MCGQSIRIKSSRSGGCSLVCLVIFLINLCNHKTRASALVWDNAVDLNEDFRLLWTAQPDEITFEVQVATLGYVGLGFSENGALDNADMAVGWVDDGQVYFQDRHVKKDTVNGEPIMDPSQDYFLLLGYQTATHTVLRFRRKLDTCDTMHDNPITNDTIRVLFMYSNLKPEADQTSPESLPKPLEAYRGYKSMYLLQKLHQTQYLTSNANFQAMELRHEDAVLPTGDDTLYWCKLFKLEDFDKKQHIVGYEPVFDSNEAKDYIHHMILYECPGSSNNLDHLSRESGFPCHQNNDVAQCNAIVAMWTKGSEGFTYPEEAGFPIDIKQARFYLMETHYNQEKGDGNGVELDDQTVKVDNSGLKLFYTQQLRKFDAGVLSIGIESNWRHIIPPGQELVLSEGHCIEECTKKGFPPLGINIFGVLMRTHQIGKSIRLRHIRGREELPPVAKDINTDSYYQEYRKLTSPVRAMPGDRLIAECTYDSSNRKAITLGGTTIKEETCQVLTIYYPRQKELTTCHSLPSLPTVLHSLGIQELAMGSNPVLIAAPPDLAGMTLESRLVTYDWANHFRSFQKVTQRGSFKVMCWNAKKALMTGTEQLDGHSPNLTKVWRSPNTCGIVEGANRNSIGDQLNRLMDESEDGDPIIVLNENLAGDGPVLEENEKDGESQIQGVARSKVSRSSAMETFGPSSSSSRSCPRQSLHYLCNYVVISINVFSLPLLLKLVLSL